MTTDSTSVVFDNFIISADSIEDVISGVEVQEIFPKTSQLYQNYPNPFNPITAIGYQLSAVSFVDLSIYNLLGQRVATLVSKNQPVGNYSVQWDASGFASGVYIYILQTNTGFKQSMKLLLLK